MQFGSSGHKENRAVLPYTFIQDQNPARFALFCGCCMRNFFRISVVSICVLGLLGAPCAFARNKDVLALQAQVQQMQEMMVAMQQANDERYATMHQLMQSTSQSLDKIAGEVSAMQKSVQDQQGKQADSLQQLSGQMQSMNDSLDELRARLDKIDKQLSSVQSQQQTLVPGQPVPAAAAPGSQPQDASGTTPGASPGATSGVAPSQPPPPTAPPVNQLYQSAGSDYNAAKYNLASQEFGDVIKYYPQSEQAGNSQFYLGEIDYRSGNYASAIKNYDAVLTQYPGSAKAATAQLRKGESELKLNRRQPGIKDLRTVIYRYPQTPEAMQARSKLNGMGVRIYVKPSAARE
jgi:tol-pal system protein YbgF